MSRDDMENYWPCACVKRKPNGDLSHIRLNHRSLKRCRVCKAERPEKEWFDARVAERCVKE